MCASALNILMLWKTVTQIQMNGLEHVKPLYGPVSGACVWTLIPLRLENCTVIAVVMGRELEQTGIRLY